MPNRAPDTTEATAGTAADDTLGHLEAEPEWIRVEWFSATHAVSEKFVAVVGLLAPDLLQVRR